MVITKSHLALESDLCFVSPVLSANTSRKNLPYIFIDWDFDPDKK